MVISWLMIVGIAREASALGTGMDSKSSRFSFMADSAPIPAECIEVVRRQMEQAAQFLPLDYDPDVSFANVENRLQMLIMNAKAQGCGEAHGETA